MSGPPPILCAWDGESFTPIPAHARICDRHYVVGERYALVPHEDRSQKSHNQYFAAIHDAWRNLPEGLAELYPTEEHLRKRALIVASFFVETAVTCATRAEALRWAKVARGMDEFAHVLVPHDAPTTVLIRTAKSQSMRAMGKDEFQRSKTLVLEIIAEMVGVTAGQLGREAGRAA